MNIEQVSHLKNQGFDLTEYDKESKHYTVQCSQCEVMIIQQVATHEIGCPNANYDYDDYEECNDSSPGHPVHYGSK